MKGQSSELMKAQPLLMSAATPLSILVQQGYRLRSGRRGQLLASYKGKTYELHAEGMGARH